MGVQRASPAEVKEILGPRMLWMDVFAATLIMTEGKYDNDAWGILASINAADASAGKDARPQAKIRFGGWGYCTIGKRDPNKVAISRKQDRRFFTRTYRLDNWEENPDERTPV